MLHHLVFIDIFRQAILRIFLCCPSYPCLPQPIKGRSLLEPSHLSIFPLEPTRGGFFLPIVPKPPPSDCVWGVNYEISCITVLTGESDLCPYLQSTAFWSHQVHRKSITMFFDLLHLWTRENRSISTDLIKGQEIKHSANSFHLLNLVLQIYDFS